MCPRSNLQAQLLSRARLGARPRSTMADTLDEHEWDVILREHSEQEELEDAREKPDEQVAPEELVTGVAGDAAVASGSASSTQDEEVGGSSVGAPDEEALTANGASPGMLVPHSPVVGGGAQAADVASLACASVAVKAVGAGAKVAGAATGQIKTMVSEVLQRSSKATATRAAMWGLQPLAR
jgi:hypothetical protein